MGCTSILKLADIKAALKAIGEGGENLLWVIGGC